MDVDDPTAASSEPGPSHTIHLTSGTEHADAPDPEQDGQAGTKSENNDDDDGEEVLYYVDEQGNRIENEEIEG